MHATTGLSWFGNITSFAFSTAHRVLNQVRVINQVNPTAVINCADLVRHVDCMQRQDRACLSRSQSSWPTVAGASNSLQPNMPKKF
jgi:hypothetical protein